MMSLNQKLKIAMAANTAFAVLEILVGLASGSLALISDAAHNLTDSLSILVAFIGQKIASRPATEEHTFGYGKATILTALVNSLMLIVVAGYIFYEAYMKIIHPEPVKGGLIMLVAGAGILVNGGVAGLFLKDRGNLNMKGVFLNMAFDTLVSIGAVFAGLIIVLTGKTLADPVISIAIGTMLIYGSIQIVNQAVHVLLEGVPEHIKTPEVLSAIQAMPQVKNVHDLHIWSMASQKPALSCHILAQDYDLIKNVELIRLIKLMLKDKFQITHATIEVELELCPPHEH